MHAGGRVPDRVVAALRAAVRGGRLQGVSGTAYHQPVTLPVLLRLRGVPYLRLVARDALQDRGVTHQHRSDRGDDQAYGQLPRGYEGGGIFAGRPEGERGARDAGGLGTKRPEPKRTGGRDRILQRASVLLSRDPLGLPGERGALPRQASPQSFL